MKSKKFKLTLTLVLLLAIAGAGCWIWKKKNAPYLDIAAAPKCRVTRGDMVLSLLQTGELDAKRNILLKNETERETKIINVVDDGTYVKKGDLLVELDAEDLENKLIVQRAEVSKASADLDAAEKGIDIDDLKFKTDRKAAELKLEFAKLDLKKYQEAEYQQQLHKTQADIELAQGDLKRSQDKYDWSKKLVEKGYTSRMEMEANESDVKQKDVTLKSLIETLDILQKYTHDKDLQQKMNDVMAATDELSRLIKSRESDRARTVSALESKKIVLEANRKQLKKLETQVSNSKILADFEGLVFYPIPDRWRAERNIEKGATVFPRQVLLKYPDLSAWIINVGVPEAIIDKVKEGQDSVATFDALPGVVVRAVVDKVALVPDKGGKYLDTNTKTYTVTLDIPTTPTAELRPGMSAMVQIITGRLANTLRVPIQAVTSQENRPIVYVIKDKDAVPTFVEIGKSNDDFVQILSGVTEGQELLLYAPVEKEARAGANEQPIDQMEEEESAKLGSKAPAKRSKDRGKIHKADAPTPVILKTPPKPADGRKEPAAPKTK